jgi:hypothetical protein
MAKAFSSEVGTGSREENAPKQKWLSRRAIVRRETALFANYV